MLVTQRQLAGDLGVSFCLFRPLQGEAKTAHELQERGIELVERRLGLDHLGLLGWLHNRALLLEEQVRTTCTVLAWKYDKGLMSSEVKL